MKLNTQSFAKGDIVLFPPHSLQGTSDVDESNHSLSRWIVGVVVGLPLERSTSGAEPEERDGDWRPKHCRRAWNRLLYRIAVVGGTGSTLRGLADTLLTDLDCIENEAVEVLDEATADRNRKPSTALPEWRAKVRDRIIADVQCKQSQDGADFDNADCLLESAKGNGTLVPSDARLAHLRSLCAFSDDLFSTVGPCTFLHESALRRPSEVKVDRSLTLWQILPILARADGWNRMWHSFRRWREDAAAMIEEESRLRARSALTLQTQARRFNHRNTISDLRLRKARADEREKWQMVHRKFSYIDANKSEGNGTGRRYNVRGTKVLLPTLSSAKLWFELMRKMVNRFAEITDARLKYLLRCAFESWREMVASQKKELRLMSEEEIYGS